MKVEIENKDKVLMENAYFENEEGSLGICGLYGLTYLEIFQKSHALNKEEFLELYELMTAIKKEIDRLDNLQESEEE